MGAGLTAAGALDLVDRVRPVALAGEQRLPVLPALESLVPGGLRRGTVVVTDGAEGATSLALALAAEASVRGSWVAVVGMAALGLRAAGEIGVALDHLALVDPREARAWPTVVATLVEAFDLVLACPPPRIRSGDARRLESRARERGSVLVLVGAGWATGPDLRLTVARAEWHGLGRGHGYLQARQLAVTTQGRREATRPRTSDLWLLDHEGRVTAVPAHPAPRPLRRLGAELSKVS